MQWNLPPSSAEFRKAIPLAWAAVEDVFMQRFPMFAQWTWRIGASTRG